MFKFKIIESAKQSASDPLVNLTSNKMNFLPEQLSPLENQDQITLIITDLMDQEIIGSISLIKQDLSHLQKDIRRLIPTGTFYRGYVWECSSIYFTHSQTLSSEFSPERNFYRSLYEGIVEFGQQQEVGFVVVKLTGDAYPPTKDLGSWPYIIEFLPDEFPEDHFYGILPLRGCFYEEYQQKLKVLDEK